MVKLTGIVIDDDSDIALLFKEMLSLHGINVLGIGKNGTEAIDLFTEKSPQIVFMDVHMPKLNGIEALKKIKEISPQSVVVMITGDTSDALKQSLHDVGMDAFISKPLSMQKFNRVMNDIKSSKKLAPYVT